MIKKSLETVLLYEQYENEVFWPKPFFFPYRQKQQSKLS